MKLKRMNAPFFQKLSFRGYNTNVSSPFNNALETAYKTLFNKTDFRKISATEITHINELIKTGVEIINNNIPDDEPNINDITLFVYLSKAIQTFYKEQSAGTNFLESQRATEDKKASQLGIIRLNGKLYKARKLYGSDIYRDRNEWIPKQTKTYLRSEFYKKYGAYPEQLYAALIFYLVKTFYPQLHSQIKNQVLAILSLITEETTLHHSQMQHGKQSHSKTNHDDLYKMLRDAFINGKFNNCNGMLALQNAIIQEMQVGTPTAKKFIKRLKIDFPDSPIFKRKRKIFL